MNNSENNAGEFLKGLNWRAFFISFLVIFLLSALHYLNLLPDLSFKKTTLVSPLSDPISKVKPLLEKKENTYKLSHSFGFPPDAHAEIGNILASSYIIVDYDKGEVIQEKNSNVSVPIASLTKVMSAVVALDLSSKDERFLVSKEASEQIPTKIGVIPSEEMTLEELLHASLLTSANDAVEVMEEGIDKKYGKGTFVDAMNQKARFLGLTSTSFDNPQGFDGEKNFSTAHDLSILTHYALENYPLIEEIVKKDYQYLPENNRHKKYDLQNWNGLIGVYPNTFGVKIGYTGDAGKTTIVASERGGRKILVVVLGAQDEYDRDLTAANLLDIGFEETLGLPRIAVTKEELDQKYSSWVYWN